MVASAKIRQITAEANRVGLALQMSELYSSIARSDENLPQRARIQGMANKWSAAGFLAKVYAYLASCKINNVGAELDFDLNNFNWVNSQKM